MYTIKHEECKLNKNELKSEKNNTNRRLKGKIYYMMKNRNHIQMKNESAMILSAQNQNNTATQKQVQNKIK